LFMALGLAGGVFALALSWAFTLRRRVETRTALLAREVRARHDAELLSAERARLAADLHDGIAQTLTGAAFQLEVAQAAPDPNTHLSLAQRLLDRSRDDLRRALWDLTPGALLERDLPGALAQTGRELSAEACSVEVRTEGTPVPLPDRLRAHLFRVGQEAISNAVRHGEAKRIDVCIRYAGEQVVLTVADDGRGFEPKAAPGPETGHFGLRALRERLHRLGGELTIESGATGTRLVATVPLPGEPT
jgi:signal transduction histidine kinase